MCFWVQKDGRPIILTVASCLLSTEKIGLKGASIRALTMLAHPKMEHTQRPYYL